MSCLIGFCFVPCVSRPVSECLSREKVRRAERSVPVTSVLCGVVSIAQWRRRDGGPKNDDCNDEIFSDLVTGLPTGSGSHRVAHESYWRVLEAWR